MDSRSPPPSPAGPKGELAERIAEAEARYRESRRRRLALLGGLALAAVMLGLVIRSEAPTRIVAQWHLSNAQARFEEEDFDGALAACDRALALLPEEPELYQLRAQINHQRGDLPAALEDLNELLKRNPHFPQGYLQRGAVQQTLKNYDAAIADARKAREWWGDDHPLALNNTAYALAVANRDLEAALQDANRAIQLVKDKRRAADDAKSQPDGAASKTSDAAPADAAESPAQAGDMALASYLDTRGFIRFRLGQQTKDAKQAQAHYQAALADFDEAIGLFTRMKKVELDRLKAQGGASQARLERRLNEDLGLMHQHRYQVYEALGEKDKAAADQEFASRLGYDPAKHGQ